MLRPIGLDSTGKYHRDSHVSKQSGYGGSQGINRGGRNEPWREDDQVNRLRVGFLQQNSDKVTPRHSLLGSDVFPLAAPKPLGEMLQGMGHGRLRIGQRFESDARSHPPSEPKRRSDRVNRRRISGHRDQDSPAPGAPGELNGPIRDRSLRIQKE